MEAIREALQPIIPNSLRKPTRIQCSDEKRSKDKGRFGVLCMDHGVLNMYGDEGPCFLFSLWSSKGHQCRDQNQIHSIRLFFCQKNFIFLPSFTCIHFFSAEMAKPESYLSTLLSLFVLMLRV